jgi:hypothetical protein
MSPSSSQYGNSGDLVPGDGRTDVTSVLDHSLSTPSARPRFGAASAATLALLTAAGLLLDQSGTADAASAIGLGTADSFAVLAGAGITNTGSTVITGDIGSSPLATIIGDNDGLADDITLAGTKPDPTVTAGAKDDLVTAYNNAKGQASNQTISADLANPTATLTPGVYSSPSASSMGLTGELTLDAQGNADAVFVFQVGSTLTTGPSSSVVLIGGAQACNVFWQVGSSATLDTNTAFVGNILADQSITLNTGASVEGRLLASVAAVTLDNNVITKPGCTAPTPPSTPPTGPTGVGSGPSGPSAQVPRVPVGSVDAGDGTSVTGRTPDARE